MFHHSLAGHLDCIEIIRNTHVRHPTLHAVPRYHHAVVCAQLRWRYLQLEPHCVANEAQLLADVLIAGNATADHLRTTQFHTKLNWTEARTHRVKQIVIVELNIKQKYRTREKRE